ncbi:MAG TPA: HIT domain-containing protein [Bellilinea sp.]|nr:HIT domain-containing protein [Bellilinea sp.]
MEHLWSPWRMEYIMGNNPKSGCIFCDALAQEDGPDNLIVTRGPLAFVMMNRYPYTSGHIMVVPNDHQPSLELLDAATRAEMMEVVAHGIQVMQLVYKPEGFNVGVNIGSVAGAGVADHVHMHIVPRWAGDTNFMSTLAGARVLPEALEDSFRRLREAWDKV